MSDYPAVVFVFGFCSGMLIALLIISAAFSRQVDAFLDRLEKREDPKP